MRSAPRAWLRALVVAVPAVSAAAAVWVFPQAPAATAAAPALPKDVAAIKDLLTGGNIAGTAKAKLTDWVGAKAKELWEAHADGFNRLRAPSTLSPTVEVETSLPAMLARIRAEALPARVDPIERPVDQVNAVAAIYRDVLMPLLKDAKNPPKVPEALDQAAILLTDFRAPGLLTTYFELAELPLHRPAVRWRVMWVLQQREFRDMQKAGAPNAAAIRTFLEGRLKAETSAGVVAEAFAVLDNPDDNKASLDGTLKGLRARLDRYYAGDMDGVGGEGRALETLERVNNEAAALVTASRNEIVELTAKLCHVCGIRYTEFGKDVATDLTVRRESVAEARTGLWECVVQSDRLFNTLSAGMAGSSQKPEVEKAFVDLVNGVKLPGGATGRDPVDAPYGSDNLLLYEGFVKQLEARRRQAEELLKAAKHPNAELPQPKPWKLRATGK